MNIDDENHSAIEDESELNLEGVSMSPEETNKLQRLHDKLISQVQENKTNILIMKGMLEGQSTKIDKIYDALVGNGRRDSVYARLLAAEHNQEEASKERKLLGKELAKLFHAIELLEKQVQDDQKTLETKVDKNTETVQSWRNRAIGIGLGAGAGTGLILWLLQQLISQAAATP